METTYFRLFASFTTYLLLISLTTTTFLLLLSSNVGKVAEFWTLTAPWHGEDTSKYDCSLNPTIKLHKCPE